jgi:hypothetical protein
MLTERKKRFIEAYVANGGSNAAAAARQAGVPKNHANQQAYHWLREPAVQEAIRIECDKLGKSMMPLARRLLRDIMMDPKHPQHFRALTFYLATMGFAPAGKTDSKLEHTVSSSAIDKLKRLTEIGGIDPHKLIAAKPSPALRDARKPEPGSRQ